MLAQAQAEARCDWRSSVDRHFQRCIRPAEESALRAHLPHCPRCRRRYDRHLLLGQILRPRRDDAADRLATGLGLRAVSAPAGGAHWPLSDWRWVVAGLALGLGAVTLVLSPADRTVGSAQTHQEVTLEIFRHTPDGLSDTAGGEVAPGDRLVFAVRNDRWRYLTIAGLDEAGTVHLLSPTRAIARTAGLQLLPELGLPALPGPHLRVVALLTDRPLAANELAQAAGQPLPPATGVRLEIPLLVRSSGARP